MISHVVKMSRKVAVAARVGAHPVRLRRRGRFVGFGTAAAALVSPFRRLNTSAARRLAVQRCGVSSRSLAIAAPSRSLS